MPRRPPKLGLSLPAAPARRLAARRGLVPLSRTAARGDNAPRPLTVQELLPKFAAVPPNQTVAGPLTLTVQPDPSRGQAVVTAALSGTVLETQVLMLSSPVLNLNIVLDAAAATGTITLALGKPPQISSVQADVVATQGSTSFPCKGSLASWTATAAPVVGDYATILGSELKTLTTVRGFNAELADFQFYSGTLAIGPGVTLAQLAPTATFPEIVAGSVDIRLGANATLYIPTTLQPGMLFLQATFSTATTPPTRVSSSVANWALPGAS